MHISTNYAYKSQPTITLNIKLAFEQIIIIMKQTNHAFEQCKDLVLISNDWNQFKFNSYILLVFNNK